VLFSLLGIGNRKFVNYLYNEAEDVLFLYRRKVSVTGFIPVHCPYTGSFERIYISAEIKRNFVKLINRRCRYKMARYTGASCKLCRRENQKLFLKGERCYTNKCSIDRRSYAPGMHGQQRKKVSEYGIQLREKQKAKRFYGVLESQFRKYYEMAIRKKGITGENLLQILESRLDNVVHRMGFGVSRDESRQLVTHGHFLINGKRVNIPSYLVKPGDVIEVSEKSRKSPRFKDILEVTGGKVIPKWLEVDHENLKGKVITLPDREDIDLPIQEHLIVELYSK